MYNISIHQHLLVLVYIHWYPHLLVLVYVHWYPHLYTLIWLASWLVTRNVHWCQFYTPISFGISVYTLIPTSLYTDMTSTETGNRVCTLHRNTLTRTSFGFSVHIHWYQHLYTLLPTCLAYKLIPTSLYTHINISSLKSGHIWMSHVSHTWMSHVTHVDESCHPYK